MPTLHLAATDEADDLLGHDRLALLIGMLPARQVLAHMNQLHSRGLRPSGLARTSQV